MKWQYFIGACALAGYAVIMAGGPVVAVYGGVALAALWNFFLLSRKSRSTRPAPDLPGRHAR